MLEEDAQTIKEMRRSTPREQRSFMPHNEFGLLRKTVLKVTQARLAEQFIKPSTGEPVNTATICYWEQGARPIPLWAARHMLGLAAAARRYDTRGEE